MQGSSDLARMLSRHSILTPSLLIDFAKTAKERELETCHESVSLSQDFKNKSEVLKKELAEEMDSLREQIALESSSDERRGPHP